MPGVVDEAKKPFRNSTIKSACTTVADGSHTQSQYNTFPYSTFIPHCLFSVFTPHDTASGTIDVKRLTGGNKALSFLSPSGMTAEINFSTVKDISINQSL